MIEGDWGWQPESQGSPLAGANYEALAAEIIKNFAGRMAALRRRLRPCEIPAAMRALQQERQAALKAVRERLATERQAEQMIRRARRPPRASLE